MLENPISAIENAELEAKQALVRAGDEKVRLIQKAKEDAQAAFISSEKKAMLKSSAIIESAQKELESENEEYSARLEADKAELIGKAKNSEKAAIKSIIDIIRGTG